MQEEPIKNDIQPDLTLQCTKRSIYEFDFFLKKTLMKQKTDSRL